MKGKVNDLRDEVIEDILRSSWGDAVLGLQQLIQLDAECEEGIEDMIRAEVDEEYGG